MAALGTEGIVLRKVNFRETSVLLDLFTAKMGKIRGVLKGVRTSPGRVSPLSFQPGSYIFVFVYPQRGSHLVLFHAPQVIDAFAMEETECSFIWQLMLRLVNLFLPEREKNEEILKLMLTSGRLLTGNVSPSLVYLWFKIRLISLLGYGLEMNRCSCCHHLRKTWLVSGRQGGLVCLPCSRQVPDAVPVSSAVIGIMRHLKRVPASRLKLITNVPAFLLEKINFTLNLVFHYHSDPGLIWWSNEKNIFKQN